MDKVSNGNLTSSSSFLLFEVGNSLNLTVILVSRSWSQRKTNLWQNSVCSNLNFNPGPKKFIQACLWCLWKIPGLFTTYHLPLTTNYLPLTTYHLPLTTYHLPHTTYYLQLTTYHLTLKTYHLPHTTYYLPVTTKPFIYHLQFCPSLSKDWMTWISPREWHKQTQRQTDRATYLLLDYW